ncbi:MAG: hypothetical protein K8T91_15460, partial [Planctomycetes bacterium]|nr:hypothetical protein [Planctomycetota bacterium]
AADTSVTPQGLLRYTAPAKVNAPTRVTFTVEILGKDGRTVLHQFPVFVLPTPPAEPKLDPASPPLQNP